MPINAKYTSTGLLILYHDARYINPLPLPFYLYVEKMQKRAAKFIISLKKYSYKDRLIQLNLPTLKYRRLRWDMIEVFKIVKQKHDTILSIQ